jgi:hypothetical protein
VPALEVTIPFLTFSLILASTLILEFIAGNWTGNWVTLSLPFEAALAMAELLRSESFCKVLGEQNGARSS